MIMLTFQSCFNFLLMLRDTKKNKNAYRGKEGTGF
jgi:hypothetical protein